MISAIRTSARYAHSQATQHAKRALSAAPSTRQDIETVSQTLLATPVTHNNKKSIMGYFNQYFNTYLKQDSVRPVVDFLKTSGLTQTQIEDNFKDHMALRAPTKYSGIKLIQHLIGAGIYGFEATLPSNQASGTKNAIQEVSIGAGNQYGVTLSATGEALTHGMPNYLFVSMKIDHSNHSDLFTNLNEPFQTEYFDNILIHPYWQPAETLTRAHGTGAANHFTLSVNGLVNLGFCDDIDDLRQQFLNAGFKENTNLAVEDCPDVTQYALTSAGDGVYVEYLQRAEGIPGFSTNTANINRIGGHVR